uniref:Uncharacterized protein n=1 Tax=Peronospora matthiolae TaxID=2874970 RepID=A0AAV1T7C6_9STRA
MKLVTDLVLAAIAVISTSAGSFGTNTVPVIPTAPRRLERMGPGYPANGLPPASTPSTLNNNGFPVASPAGPKGETGQDTKQSTNTFIVPNKPTVLTPEQLEGRGPQVPAKQTNNTPSFGEFDDLVYFDPDNVNKLGPKKGGGLTSG